MVAAPGGGGGGLFGAFGQPPILGGIA